MFCLLVVYRFVFTYFYGFVVCCFVAGLLVCFRDMFWFVGWLVIGVIWWFAFLPFDLIVFTYVVGLSLCVAVDWLVAYLIWVVC